MKRILRPAALALTSVLLVACADQPQQRPRPGTKKPGFNRPPSTGLDNPPPDDGDHAPVRERPSPPPVENTAPPKTGEHIETGDVPYAKPVPGKTGFVTSPYGSAKDYIDVRGFPPGTPVKDPYSNKTILVP